MVTPVVGQWRFRYLVAHLVAEVHGEAWRAACEGRFPASTGMDEPERRGDVRCHRCEETTR